MLSTFFNPSTAFGWVLSIAGTLFLLGVCWRLMIRLRATAPKNQDAALLAKFDSLYGRIKSNGVPEKVFLKWIERIPQGHPRDRSAIETNALTSTRTILVEAMRKRKWARDTMSWFIYKFWSITVKDIDELLSVK